jgi:hypothetical protein
VSNQVDFHLVRAETNALEFRHRIMRPWSKDPGCYVDIIPTADFGNHEGGWGYSDTTKLPPTLPLPVEVAEVAARRLGAVRGVVEQAQANMHEIALVAPDLGDLAVYRLRGEHVPELESICALDGLPAHHPALALAAADALAAIGEYIGWIEGQKPRMEAMAGCGKENYDWLLKNVYYVPHTFDEALTILELEDNRVVTFQMLEANRNRAEPELVKAQTNEEYRAKVHAAIEHLMSWYHDEGFWTVRGKLPTAADVIAPEGGGHAYEKQNPYLGPGRFRAAWHSPTEAELPMGRRLIQTPLRRVYFVWRITDEIY